MSSNCISAFITKDWKPYKYLSPLNRWANCDTANYWNTNQQQTDSCNRNLILKTILLRKISKAQRVFIVCSCLYEVLGKAELISNCIKQISGFFSTVMYLVHRKWGTGIWCECNHFHLDCDGWNVGEYPCSIWSNCTCSRCIILSVNDTLVKVE